MAYQDWLTQTSNTSAVGSNIPPALIPIGNSVLNEQPVPSSYTSNQAQRNTGNTAISSQGQINSIMNSINPQTGTTNPFSSPSGGGGGGNAPLSWGGYSSGGTAGPSGPSTGTGNTGVTQNYNTGGWNPDVSGGNWGGVDQMDQMSSWLSQQPWAQTSGAPTGSGQGQGQNVLGTGQSWGDLGIMTGNALFPGLGTFASWLFPGNSSGEN